MENDDCKIKKLLLIAPVSESLDCIVPREIPVYRKDNIDHDFIYYEIKKNTFNLDENYYVSVKDKINIENITLKYEILKNVDNINIYYSRLGVPILEIIIDCFCEIGKLSGETNKITKNIASLLFEKKLLKTDCVPWVNRTLIIENKRYSDLPEEIVSEWILGIQNPSYSDAESEIVLGWGNNLIVWKHDLKNLNSKNIINSLKVSLICGQVYSVSLYEINKHISKMMWENTRESKNINFKDIKEFESVMRTLDICHMLFVDFKLTAQGYVGNFINELGEKWAIPENFDAAIGKANICRRLLESNFQKKTYKRLKIQEFILYSIGAVAFIDLAINFLNFHLPLEDIEKGHDIAGIIDIIKTIHPEFLMYGAFVVSLMGLILLMTSRIDGK